jgi:hypothetical protein
MKFEVLAAVCVCVIFSRVAPPGRLLGGCQHFGGKYYLQLHFCFEDAAERS